MFRSTYQSEREIVKSADHIAAVTASIRKNFDRYFDLFVAHCQPTDGVAAAAAVLGTKYKVKSAGKPDPASGMRARLDDTIRKYEAEAERYRSFFNAESLDEYRQCDPKLFKRDLASKKNCPIVADCVNSRREEMHLWQAKFQGRNAADLLDVFTNLYNAAVDYASSCDREAYASAPSREALGLDEFDEADELFLEGVVGNGIRSYVLYHLHPDLFPICARQALFALFFLSGKGHFHLPSEMSEFLMVDDSGPTAQILTLEHNYWYPYSLLTWYRLELYRLMESRCSTLNVKLDPKWRYVYTSAFVEFIVGLPDEAEALRCMKLPKDEDHA
jgi:hypothetical protein